MKRWLALLAALACARAQKVPDQRPDELAAARAQIENARRNGWLESLLRDLRNPPPHTALGLYALGLAEFAAGNEPQAIAALGKSRLLKPDEPDIPYRMGLILLDAEKFAEAREPLAKAVALAPKTARYRPPLAVCLARLGDRTGAIDALRDFPRLDPTPEEALPAVKAARSLTDLFRDIPPAARPDLETSLGHLVRDAPGLAMPQLEALLARMPDLAPAHALLGLAAARLDEAGRAVTELKRAAELQPDLPQPHAWLAEVYAAKERPDLAMAEYSLAMERNPLDGESLRRLGELRASRGVSGALETLRQAALLLPEDDGLQLEVARAEIAARQPIPAKARLERLSERRPDDPEVLLRLAMILFDERAKAEFEKKDMLTQRVEDLLHRVLALQPENATANRLLSALRSG